MIIHNKKTEHWKVTIADTGLDTQTGGRIKRIKDYVGEETFMVTYGDAVGDIDIKALLDFHRNNRKIGTISLYNFGQNKGVVERDDNNMIKSFREKADQDGQLINIGFMVMEPRIFDYIEGDHIPFEKDPMKNLVKEHQLVGYVHDGFWHCMDTLNEKRELEKMWETGHAPWKVWSD